MDAAYIAKFSSRYSLAPLDQSLCVLSPSKHILVVSVKPRRFHFNVLFDHHQMLSVSVISDTLSGYFSSCMVSAYILGPNSS